MANLVNFTVTGDRKIELIFEEFPQRMHAALLARVREITDRLEMRVRGGAPRLTGKLQSLIKEVVYDDRGDRISGRVSVTGEYAKAAALEYGVHRDVAVKAHLEYVNHVFGARLSAPSQAMVKAYNRKVDLQARRFLRGPEAEMSGEITQDLQDAIDQAVDETSGS